MDRFDKPLMLELARRIGEAGLKEAVHKFAPAEARPFFDAMSMQEGGLLTFVETRIERFGVTADSNLLEDTSVGCFIGVFAVVAGVAVNGILGGFTAVVGIVAVAAYC